MNIQQIKMAAKSLTLNEKGADAFTTTNNYLIDLFVRCSKNPFMTSEQFHELTTEMGNALKQDPVGFIKLIKFQRHILNGNGIKHYYYLGMKLMQRCCISEELFEKLVDISYQYNKDLHHFGKPGSILYAKKIKTQLLQLINPVGEPKERYDPMLFKYLSYRTGYWAVQLTHIQEWLNCDFMENPQDYAVLKDHCLEKETFDIGCYVHELLHHEYVKPDRVGGIFTNRVMRKLKSRFNRDNHLPEYLFSGKHYDGTRYDFNPEKKTEEAEKIAKEISQTAGIATRIFCKTMEKWQGFKEIIDSEKRRHAEHIAKYQIDDYDSEDAYDDRDKLDPIFLTPVRKLLMLGYEKYIENLKMGKATVKEVGVDLSSMAYNYYMNIIERNYDENTPEIIIELEQLLNKRVERLRTKWLSCFNETYTIEDFANSVELLFDRSGSMEGTPCQTGLLCMFMMVRVFRIKKIILFDTTAEVVDLTDEDVDGDILNSLYEVYTAIQGSTNLMSAFQTLENQGVSNKNVIIFTDSDCDPVDSSSTSAFHYAFDAARNKYLHTNRFIIMNLKETKMGFPYMNFNENVCYINGINTIDYLIEALITTHQKNIPFTPDLVLKCCLDSDKFVIPGEIQDMLKNNDLFDISRLVLDTNEIDEILYEWKRHLPSNIYKQHQVSDYRQDELKELYLF